ncbi:Uncharacterised protein [Mycobacteroides abscessus subsp. abscessus]|nr:Uncharacterised protein [Mycobacteroides abscessus subsp. abscessus]
MRDAADHVCTHFQRFFHQLCPAWIRKDPLLRKSNQLQINMGRHFFFYFQERLQRRQGWIRHIHMCADMLDSLCDLPFERFFSPLLYILMC